MTKRKREESSQELDAQRHYSSYENWKGLDDCFTFSNDGSEYFKGEMRGIGLSGKDVLEIGFGSGSFLAWAKDGRANIAGTKISGKSHTEAKQHGVELLSADIENITCRHKERFDVFGYFSLDEIVVRTSAIETILRTGGYFVSRFLNGQSPLGIRCFVRRFCYFAQGVIGATLNFIYSCYLPWDAVVALVLQKTDNKNMRCYLWKPA